jgi:hypothetical protein
MSVKTQTRFVLFLVYLFVAVANVAFGQITTAGIENAPSYDSFTPPQAGSAYNDPKFGSRILRVSNAADTPNADRGGYLTWIENEYSTANPFNNDNSKFLLLHESYFALYDGATGLYLHDLPVEINASSEPRWSRKDLVTLYYHKGNQLRSYDVSTGGIGIVHSFVEYSAISGNGESDISLDGDHFVLVGDGQHIFAYQLSTDQKFAAFDLNGSTFDSVYITPNNNVIVSWYPSGTGRFTGQELFDINMNFLRQVGHADGHKHLTVDTDGQEVLIWTNSNDPAPIDNCSNGIVKIVLSTAAQKCLLQLDWSLAVHISAADGNGSVFVDTEAPSNPESGSSEWKPYTNEIVQVKLDGSTVTRLAHHRSRAVDSYVWQPKLSVSRDGSRVLFSSNLDLQAIDGRPADYADTYLLFTSNSISTPVTPVTSNPPAAPTSQAIVRYEQDSANAKHTGTWFNNGGGFNSSGSSILAMDSGSEFAFSFTGSKISWIAFRDQWSGIARVLIDGIDQGTVDTYLDAEKPQAEVYSSPVLPYGRHTLTISVTGEHSQTASGSWIWVDALDVTQ